MAVIDDEATAEDADAVVFLGRRWRGDFEVHGLGVG
jgi:hypothetical protein